MERNQETVGLVYPIALASYEWAQKKNESLDARIQTLLVFAVSIVLVVPTQIHVNLSAAKFSSGFFVFSMLSFAIGVGMGIAARMLIHLRQLHPDLLYNHYCDLSPEDFKREIIKIAGSHLQDNRKYLRKKKDLGLYMLSFFSLGGGLLLIWVIKAAS